MVSLYAYFFQNKENGPNTGVPLAFAVNGSSSVDGEESAEYDENIYQNILPITVSVN
jgi:hypothetical protein